MAQILIVDDVPAMREQYAYDLRRLGRHQTFVAACLAWTASTCCARSRTPSSTTGWSPKWARCASDWVTIVRQLHRLSPRAAGPFVPVNCAALPENLVESELFGHEAGAYKGAFEAEIG